MAAPLTLGPFRLGALLGSGAMGQVWRAEGPTGAVAVKIVGEGQHSDVLVQALRAEIQLAADLDHRNIARLVDSGAITAAESKALGSATSEGAPWVAMELAADTLTERRPTTVTAAHSVLSCMLDALAHAHARGVVHRDVKPDNIFSHPDPARGWVLGDFGLAVSRGDTGSGLLGGSQGFAAPEQRRRSELRRQGPWTDLYAVGAVACWLFTGDAQTWPVSLPRPWLGWLAWLLNSDATQRCGHARDARLALDALISPTMALPLPGGVAPHTHATTLDWLDDDPGPAPVEALTPPTVHHRWTGALPVPQEPLRVGPGLARFRSPPVCGRDAQQQTLWQALGRVHAGEGPELVWLQGAPGSGTSRLARWLGEWADESGLATGFRARHSLLGGRHFGLGGMVADALQVADLDDPEAVASELHDLHAIDAGAVVELLFPDRPRAQLASVGRAHDLVIDVLNALVGPRVAVVWLDDVHWGVNSLRWLARVMGPGAPRCTRWLVVGTVDPLVLDERPVESAKIAALPATRIEVGRLSPEAAASLAHDTVDLAPSVARALAEHTGGLPMFGTQLLRSWIETGLQRRPDGLHPTIPRPDWDPDLDTVWNRRVARALGPDTHGDAHRALQLACCLGTHLDEGEWDQVCDAAGVQRPPSLLSVLLDAGLVRALGMPEQRSWELVHPSLPAAVLSALPTADREAAYRVCADTLALHGAKALRWAGLAAGAGDARALRWWRYVRLTALLVDDTAAAVVDAEAWSANSVGLDRAMAQSALAHAHALRGDADGAHTAAVEALAAVDALPASPERPAARAIALHRLADAAQLHGQPHRAIELLTEAVAIGPVADGIDSGGFVASHAWGVLARLASEVGDEGLQQGALDQALATAKTRSSAGHARLHRASRWLELDDPDRAQAELAHVERGVRILGLSIESARLQLASRIAAVRGELRPARELMAEALELRAWAGLASPFGRLAMAELCLAEGQAAGATEYLRDASRYGADPSWLPAVQAAYAAVTGDLDGVGPALDAMDGVPTRILRADRAVEALRDAGRHDLVTRWESLVGERIIGRTT